MLFRSNYEVVTAADVNFTMPSGRTTAVVTVSLDATGAGQDTGSWNTFAKLQRIIGGVPTDEGAPNGPVLSSVEFRQEDVQAGPAKPTRPGGVIGGDTQTSEYIERYPASHSFSRSIANLTPGSAYPIRLLFDENVIAGGLRNHTFSGTITVTA